MQENAFDSKERVTEIKLILIANNFAVRSRSLFSSPLLKESGSLASNDDVEVLSSGDNSSYEHQGLLPYKCHVPALLDHDYTVLYPSSRKMCSRIEGMLFILLNNGNRLAG